MEELHTDSIDGGYEANYGTRSRARERTYSNSGNGRELEGGDFLGPKLCCQLQGEPNHSWLRLRQEQQPRLATVTGIGREISYVLLLRYQEFFRFFTS
jgi:hypothetical protein